LDPVLERLPAVSQRAIPQVAPALVEAVEGHEHRRRWELLEARLKEGDVRDEVGVEGADLAVEDHRACREFGYGARLARQGSGRYDAHA
jgi:hypothetical protein